MRHLFLISATVAGLTMTAPALAQSALLEEATEFSGAMLYLGLQVPGMVLGVVRNGESHVVGFGEYREGAGVPPDGDTVVRIGSITKALTGMVLASMVVDGSVALTDRLEDRLARDATVPGDPRHPIRLIDLATHSSGLPREIDLDWGPLEDPFGSRTQAAILAALDTAPLLFPPGTGGLYSNFAYELLAIALADTADQSFESLLAERVLEPLGLHATGYAPAPGHAVMQGHGFVGEPLPNVPTGEGTQGGGGLLSTANDMLRLLDWQLDRFSDQGAAMRLVGQAAYLPRDALDVTYGYDESGRMDAMGLGWVVMHGSDERPTLLQKAGGMQGQFSYIAFAPAHGTGAFVAINQFDVTAATEMPPAVNQLIANLAGR